jgi:hypothetical protein
MYGLSHENKMISIAVVGLIAVAAMAASISIPFSYNAIAVTPTKVSTSPSWRR